MKSLVFIMATVTEYMKTHARIFRLQTPSNYCNGTLRGGTTDVILVILAYVSIK